MTTNLIIEKELGGFIFFIVKVEKGLVPKELNGRYSSIAEGKKAVTRYLHNKRETATVRRDNFSKQREQRKAIEDGAKLKPEDS
jgi:hypothetical protein